MTTPIFENGAYRKVRCNFDKDELAARAALNNLKKGKVNASEKVSKITNSSSTIK